MNNWNIKWFVLAQSCVSQKRYFWKGIQGIWVKKIQKGAVSHGNSTCLDTVIKILKTRLENYLRNLIELLRKWETQVLMHANLRDIWWNPCGEWSERNPKQGGWWKIGFWRRFLVILEWQRHTHKWHLLVSSSWRISGAKLLLWSTHWGSAGRACAGAHRSARPGARSPLTVAT